jgi:hypothetical protein
MSVRKRPVVQLTSLLDMLFIMIFVSLRSQYTPPSESKPIPDDPKELRKEVVRLQKENKNLKMENEKLTMNHESVEKSKTATSPGQYRNLFVANLDYFDGEYRNGNKIYHYKETKIFTADDKTGLFSYRLNLTDASVIQGRKTPMNKSEADNFKKCTKVTISREQIAEECTYQTGWDRTLSCNRTSDEEYKCTQSQLRKGEQGKEQKQTWDYKMKLIKIYDPELV